MVRTSPHAACGAIVEEDTAKILAALKPHEPNVCARIRTTPRIWSRRR
jgi:hypothetical protein